jgi:thiamine-phosphate pyrophosphorylase
MIRYYVTDRRQGDIIAFARRAIEDGVEMIQIREKDLCAGELLELTCKIRDLARGSETRVLVNDRLDIALAADIDGVHLPSNGLPAARVRPLVRTLGVSTHSVKEAENAATARADFVVFGPVFETPGKTAVGLDALRQVTASVKIPVLAIGGVNISNAKLALEYGAAGFAAIRMFQKPI